MTLGLVPSDRNLRCGFTIGTTHARDNPFSA
jgi:hypothetical protein